MTTPITTPPATPAPVSTAEGKQELADKLYDGAGGERAPVSSDAPPPAAPPATDPSKDLTPPAEGSEATETKETEGAPEAYDLKVPEKSTIDAARVEEIATFAKEQGLSNKQAQAVLDREHKAVSSYQEQITKEQTQWMEQLKADKEFGGAALKENDTHAYRVLEKYGSQEMIKLLDETNYKSNPEVFKFLVRVGKAMANDKLVQPGSLPAVQKSAADLIYGT